MNPGKKARFIFSLMYLFWLKFRPASLWLGLLTIVLPYWLLAYLAYQPHLSIFTYLAWIFASYLSYLYFLSQNQLSLFKLLFLGSLARLPGWFTPPLFEDDWARFLWDGYMTATRGSPYLQTPAESFGDPNLPSEMQDVLNKVNYPEIPTIYGPLLQWLFYTSYLLKSAYLPPLKILFFSYEILALGFLYRRYSIKQISCFFLNPILIKEVAFNAHPDGVAVSLVLVAIALIHSSKFSWATLAMGSALAAKILAILYLPLLFFTKKARKWLLAIPAIWGLYYLPFRDILSSRESLALVTFLQQWEFNSWFLWCLSLLLPEGIARLANGAIFVTTAGSYLLYALRHSCNFKIDTWLALFFFFSPVVNAWYLLWWLPVLFFRNNWYYIILPLIAQLSYWNGANYPTNSLGWFEIPTAVRITEWLLILGLLLAGKLSKPRPFN